MIKLWKLILVAVLTGVAGASYSAASPGIISLAPNITEIIFAVGAGKQLAANTRQCDFPSNAIEILKIGDMGNVNIEKIVFLKPVMVFASTSGNSKEQVERLQSLGIPVTTLSENKAEDILSNMALLAAYFKKDVSAVLKPFRQKLKSLPRKPSGIRSLVLISVFPFFSVSTNTFLGDVLKKAGLRNTVHTSVRYPMLGQEELLQLNPELIIVPDRFKNEGMSIRKYFSRLKLRPAILYFNESALTRPGPRIFDTMIRLSRITRADIKPGRHAVPD